MTRYFYKKNHLHQLRGFCAVIETGSIMKAAEKLKTVHSNISLQILALERETKLKLFTKDNRKSIPTKEGLRLYKISKKILNDVDNLFENTISQIKIESDNIITIAAHSYVLSHLLPPYFSQIIVQNPDVQFELHNVNKEEAINMLQDELVDFIVFPLDKISPKNIVLVDFHKCRFTLAMHKDHPLATVNEKDITWDNLTEYDFISLGKNVTAQNASNSLDKYNVNSRFQIHNGTWEICLHLIKEKLTISGTDYQYFNKDSSLVLKVCPQLLPNYSFSIGIKKGSILSNSSCQLIEIIAPNFLSKLDWNYKSFQD